MQGQMTPVIYTSTCKECTFKIFTFRIFNGQTDRQTERMIPLRLVCEDIKQECLSWNKHTIA